MAHEISNSKMREKVVNAASKLSGMYNVNPFTVLSDAHLHGMDNVVGLSYPMILVLLPYIQLIFLLKQKLSIPT